MSIFDRCQYQTLVDLANACGLHLPNRRRATLTEALADTLRLQGDMALQWTHISDQAITDVGARLGLRFQATDDRAARLAILQAANVQPVDCIRALMPPVAAPPNNSAKIVLQRQLETEQHLDFLDRANMVLAGPNLTDQEKNRQLLNAAQPGTASVIIQICGARPNVSFADLITDLRTTFAVQPSTAGMRYLQAKPGPNEAYVDFGRRIQQLYHQYLGEDRTAAQDNARWITPSLILKLFTVLPPAIRGHLQVAYDKDRTMEWTKFCLLADSFVASQPTNRPGGQYNQRNQSRDTNKASTPTQICAKHGLCSHSTAECRSLKRANQPPGQQNATGNSGQRRTFNVNNIDYGVPPNDMPALGQGIDPERGPQ
jgi:hypothetical protein